MKKVTLVIGGARSGKSRYALELASRYGSRAFIATAQPCDAEMQQRVAEHRKARGDSFLTVEEPLDLAGAIRSLPAAVEVAVVDCLTLWLSNLLTGMGEAGGMDGHIEAFLEVLRDPPCDLIVVTNEVGSGIVPATPLGRRFRDLAGRVNQQAAAVADTVVLMVAGIPLIIKGEVHNGTA